jgi:hypothetical protein
VFGVVQNEQPSHPARIYVRDELEDSTRGHSLHRGLHHRLRAPPPLACMILALGLDSFLHLFLFHFQFFDSVFRIV